MGDAERHLDLWRHVADEGRARKGGQGRPPRRRRGLSHHGWWPCEILSRRPAEVRRQGPACRRRRRHRAVAERRAGHGLPVRPRAVVTVLAEEVLTNHHLKKFQGGIVMTKNIRVALTRRSLLAGASAG